ncbi:MAG: hypothetical protein O3C63_06155 [Cyanobacteria bacterium]|nr:hypothetical protein [Cyanobacteriota bacterium]MDA1020930.1 hypothetical protein [Cyanobacteriota bacterium]
MSYQFKLQIPISKDLNEKLKMKVEEIGLNSVSDIARMLLTSFANGKLELVFVDRSERILRQGELSTIVSQDMETVQDKLKPKENCQWT